jgi:hypothetical protein
VLSIVKLWEQPRCPTTDEWIRKLGIYIQWNLLSHKEGWNFVICRLMDGTGKYHLKWSEPGSKGQKLHVLSHMWNIDLMQMQQYYEALVTLRGGHVWEGYGKKRKLWTWILLIHSLYENEYRNLKPTETTIRKGLR